MKSPLDRNWRSADFEAHSNFHDTFYIRGLRPDTNYTLRALVRPRNGGLPYAAEDVPTLEARTCPERPPPVSDLYVHSSGPGWLEVRWKPPAKEACKSHVFYQARYAPHGSYFSVWRTYGYYRSKLWVHFRPTHPCSVWPQEFCLLMTDGVKPGEQHVVEVRVSRFDELTPAVSDSRKVSVRADTDCLATNECGTIGAAPVIVTSPAPNSEPNGTFTPAVTDEVDIDDPDMPTTLASITLLPSNSSDEDNQPTGTASNGEAAAVRRVEASAGDSTFGRLSPLFLTLLLLVCCTIPAAFFLGKRHGAREAVELHMVPAWRRRCGGDGGSQPVLADEGDEEDEDSKTGVSSQATLEMDHHGRFSWTKLLPQDA